jgi:hypothetical protein
MRNRFLALAALASLALTATPALATSDGLETSWYTDNQNGFTIAFPKAWKVKSNANGALVSCMSPAESAADKFRENIGVNLDQLPQKDLTLDQVSDATISQFDQIFQNLKVQSKGTVQLGDLQAKKVVFTGSLGKIHVKDLMYLVLKDDKVYSIICTAEPTKFEAYQPSFEAIAQSFSAQ